ncbi:polysaccharide deacetylase family protein [Ectothiorhodospira lacustris]|uniref:polysaccharide deacetylase family protein n=1 Tax=Ectothiorhodospira lacustris TaxID=2899127 RepID=UPI001EE80FB1|nr:polysaccharide deacetylase family protein [Ectothiorhodospira lacustris]MCG5510337.1 polysaccharide deacetylase family protein [Ectothiorhodospira lacustris]MCG5522083.1 polysaccharide deacetylase family protein [Ectothiorhodospira lacustris]
MPDMSLLTRPVLNRLSPAGPRSRLSILIFHRVLPEADPLLPGDPDARRFQWVVALLARHFTVLPLDEAVDRLRQGSLPARAACITFDDGYADNAQIALPILQAAGLPATFFVATGFLGGGRMFNDTVIETFRRLDDGLHDFTGLGLGQYPIHDPQSRIQGYTDVIRRIKHLPQSERDAIAGKLSEHAVGALPDDLMMSEEQVRALRAAGMLVGGHTVTHPILCRLDDAEAQREIHQGRAELEDILGEPVGLFAYPNGRPGEDYEARHVEMVRRAGFRAAVSTAHGVSGRGSDLYQLARFTPWDETPLRYLVRLGRNLLSPPPVQCKA